MKRNQFLNCNGLILEVSAKVKKKSAYIKIAIPDEFSEKVLKQMALNKESPIRGLQLNWYDDSIKEDSDMGVK